MKVVDTNFRLRLL